MARINTCECGHYIWTHKEGCQAEVIIDGKKQRCHCTATDLALKTLENDRNEFSKRSYPNK